GMVRPDVLTVATNCTRSPGSPSESATDRLPPAIWSATLPFTVMVTDTGALDCWWLSVTTSDTVLAPSLRLSDGLGPVAPATAAPLTDHVYVVIVAVPCTELPLPSIATTSPGLPSVSTTVRFPPAI